MAIPPFQQVTTDLLALSTGSAFASEIPLQKYRDYRPLRLVGLLSSLPCTAGLSSLFVSAAIVATVTVVGTRLLWQDGC